MSYVHNPKTKGSGILACIPQTGRCPNGCEDCFFQSGRSYLEPLDEHLPNMPPMNIAMGSIIRVNDGNDSNVRRDEVMAAVRDYPDKFYNTAIPRLDFDAPVVLTINPGEMTDNSWHKIPDPIPKNLMFVRIRTNMWNLDTVVRPAVEYYAAREVPIVLTFMAYYEDKEIEQNVDVSTLSDFPNHIYSLVKRKLSETGQYIYRKRTMNSYYAITTAAWKQVMDEFWADVKVNKWVYSCGKIEGEKGVSGCRFCGNCIREYYATKERMRQ